MEIHTPLKLLRAGIIDAWIACYPDVPDHDDSELACFHLDRLPTHLVVAEGHPLLQLGNRLSLEDIVTYPSVALPDNAFPKLQQLLQKKGLWNLPLSMKRYSNGKWEGQMAKDLTIGYANSLTLRLFSEPHIILPIDIQIETGDTLVVPRAYAENERLLKLLTTLKARAAKLADQFPDMRVVEDG